MDLSDSNSVWEDRWRTVRDTLMEFRVDLGKFRDRLEAVEKRDERTGEMIDNMLERIDSAVDEIDAVKKEQKEHRSFIDSFQGGKAAVVQTIMLAVSCVGGLLAIVRFVIGK